MSLLKNYLNFKGSILTNKICFIFLPKKIFGEKYFLEISACLKIILIFDKPAIQLG